MKHLKFAVAAAVLAAFTAATAAETAEPSVEGQGEGAIGWTPVQVGLFAPVSLPWGFDWDVTSISRSKRRIHRTKVRYPTAS